MNFLGERRQQRINREVQQQAGYAAGVVQEQIDAGQDGPYVAYVRVKGLSPEDTAKDVGRALIGRLGEPFMLDAKVAEEERRYVGEGAIIRVFPPDETS